MQAYSYRGIALSGFNATPPSIIQRCAFASGFERRTYAASQAMRGEVPSHCATDLPRPSVYRRHWAFVNSGGSTKLSVTDNYRGRAVMQPLWSVKLQIRWSILLTSKAIHKK